MSATIVPTLAKRTELGGDCKLYIITATVAAASDTITLTQATHGVSEIYGIVGATVTAGMDNAFTNIRVSFSGLTLTVASIKATGAAADDFTGTTITVALLGKSE
jgi:hypothetical protein